MEDKYVVQSNKGRGKYLYITSRGGWGLIYSQEKAHIFTDKELAEEHCVIAGKTAIVKKLGKLKVG